MLTELDATRIWRRIFRGQQVTSENLTEAESLLEELRPESPLKLRFSKELDEIRTLQLPKKPKRRG